MQTTQTSVDDRLDPNATVIQIASPSRPKTAAPSHARGGTTTLSPRDMRSPTAKYVYTGQQRKGGIGCYEVILRKRMKNARKVGIKTEHQEFGLFVKQLSRMIRMQKSQEKAFASELKKGTLAPPVIKRR